MPATVVVGTQWGDEGKGKLTDLLAKEMQMVVRYQGGHNAGHTIVVDGENFALQLVPSGDPLPPHHPDHRQRRGGGPRVLFAEIDMLDGQGHRLLRLLVVGNAHLIMPYHQELDASWPSATWARTSWAPPSGASAPPTPTRRPGSASGSRTCSTPRSSARSWTWC